MKIYVVTSGSYSEYFIEKVYLSKENADKYCSIYAKNNSTEYRVEEYETSDDEICYGVTVIIIYYNQFVDGSTPEMEIYLKPESNQEVMKDKGFYRNEWAPYEPKPKSGYKHRLTLIRHTTNMDITEEECLKKYSKVCEDLCTHIDNMVENEGWTVEMVNEYLNGEAKVMNKIVEKYRL